MRIFSLVKPVSLSLLISVINIANAESDSYAAETSVFVNAGDLSSMGESPSTDSWGVEQRFFIGDVNVDAGPRAEAAFIARSSSVAFGFRKDNLELVDGYTNFAAVDWNHASSGWSLGASLRKRDTSMNEGDSYSAYVGKYVSKATQIKLTYADTDGTTFLDFDTKASNMTTDASETHISIKHVGLDDFGFSVEAGLGVIDTAAREDQTVINLAGALYPHKNLGFGASLQVTDSDIDNDRIEVYGQWFASNALAISLRYFERDSGGARISVSEFGLDYRF